MKEGGGVCPGSRPCPFNVYAEIIYLYMRTRPRDKFFSIFKRIKVLYIQNII